MRGINRRIVSALIFSKDGKLFLGKKNPKKGGVYSDCWHLPGGGVNDNESDIDAVKREVLEETGIDISDYIIELVDDVGKGQSEKILKDTGEKVMCNMDFIVYKVIINNKLAEEINILLNDDLEEYSWRNLNDLKNHKLTPPSKDLFKRLNYI
jgi:8-oxo-dGTP pyrophosphatase MutT (NUDIX family)